MIINSGPPPIESPCIAIKHVIHIIDGIQYNNYEKLIYAQLYEDHIQNSV
jgi:hypothetical protein